MKKITTVENYIDSEGNNVITGDCEICRCFPCEHIEMSFSGWKVKHTMEGQAES